ncbi:MAG: bifunctional phosphoribosyl-AMP cyclohydrolase/phosphoribosyl-ATP diphosphatase HisIE [Saprospiraceae bacterium]|nr:bifunctional phosphoribosyl-AMP cyclohydrolase/phosphoribosyl-ATP diphosphatase HisIE [Saprospiraceae bacterium]
MELDWKKSNGLIPAIVQHAETGAVLMLGYMNPASLTRTQESGLVTFFSRSRQCLWQKGETSGNTLHLVDIRPDCDGDALLIRAVPNGRVCHTGEATCFGKAANGFLYHLEDVIRDRRALGNEATSYTARLFASGLNRIAQKVGEEATELIIEAKDDDRIRFTEEAADLLFHLLVLLAKKQVSLREVEAVLENRHQ